MPDKELKALLNKARTTPMNFLVVSKGQSIKGVIIRKKPIRESEGSAKRKELEGNAAHIGVCVGGGDGLIFRFQAEEAPKFDDKLKKFLRETAEFAKGITFEADENLEAIDEENIDIDAVKQELSGKFAAMTKRASKVIEKQPALRKELLEKLGEAKRLIQEISDERLDRVATARAFLEQLGKSLPGADATGAPPLTASASSSDDPDDDPDDKGKARLRGDEKGKGRADTKAPADPAKAKLKDAFVVHVLGGDESRWDNFHKHFSSQSQEQLLKSFGGVRGLTAVGKLLDDVCGGSAARLRRLSDELD